MPIPHDEEKISAKRWERNVTIACITVLLILIGLYALRSEAETISRFEPAPDDRQTQTQTQEANASIGDIDNSLSLKARLDAFNNQVNNGIDFLDCQPAVGYQEIDGASHSVATISGCAGYEHFHGTGAVSVGLVVPLISKEAKQAFRTKAREAEREANKLDQLRHMQDMLTQLLQENRRLSDRLKEVERNQGDQGDK